LKSLGAPASPPTSSWERWHPPGHLRTTRLQDKGVARLIECADAALANLIANDSRTRPYCLPAGDRWLAVPADAETRFRIALRKVGYSLARA